MSMPDVALNRVGKDTFVERDSLARKKKRNPIHQPGNPHVGLQNSCILALSKYGSAPMTCPPAGYASAPSARAARRDSTATPPSLRLSDAHALPGCDPLFLTAGPKISMANAAAAPVASVATASGGHRHSRLGRIAAPADPAEHQPPSRQHRQPQRR